MYATSMTQRNILKARVPDRMVWLPKPACVIAAVRLSKAQTRTQRRQAICTSVLPASKTPVNQKSLSSSHPAPLPSANSKTNKERITEFLYQAVQIPTSSCSIFIVSEGLVQIKVTITNHGRNFVVKWGGQLSVKPQKWRLCIPIPNLICRGVLRATLITLCPCRWCKYWYT